MHHEQQPIINRLEDDVIAIHFAIDHLRLLRGVLARLDPELRVPAREFEDLIGGLAQRPYPGVCQKTPPGLPVVNMCDGVVIKPRTVEITLGQMLALLERAIEWFEAIRKDLGGIDRPHLTQNSRDR